MGAQFNTAMLRATNDPDAYKEGEALIEKALYDHGHAGYSGSFAECNGVNVDSTFMFDSAQAAEEWLMDNAEKWGPMEIVKVNNGPYIAGAWCSS